jgi:hypothetical protein
MYTISQIAIFKGKTMMKQRIFGHTIFGQTHTVYTTINGDKSSNTW